MMPESRNTNLNHSSKGAPPVSGAVSFGTPTIGGSLGASMYGPGRVSTNSSGSVNPLTKALMQRSIYALALTFVPSIGTNSHG